MKKIFLAFVLSAFAITAVAQNTVIGSRFVEDQGTEILSMEDVVLGYSLSPENKNYQFRGGLSELTIIEDNDLVSLGSKGSLKSNVLMTLERLNAITKLELRNFPYVKWLDANHFSFISGGKYYQINIVDKSEDFSFNIPAGAANFTAEPVGRPELFAYTLENNLFYCDKSGNSYQVTFDQNPDIVNGQVVSRNEFGISGGIFWSKDGKRLAFYRKDESLVSDFPLLDINSREGELVNIKYPMAGMISENVQLGVYDIASEKTIFLKVDDFGREQYLTNITWSPDGDGIFVQVLNREQQHMRLNLYSAQTGDFIRTILQEKNDRFIEPLNPIRFLNSNPSKFIYVTDNRDGFKNLYIASLRDNSVKRFTTVDADVAYVGQDDKYIYYISAEVSPIEKHLFKREIRYGRATRLTSETGWHSVSLSSDAKFFIDNYSSFNLPRVIDLKSTDLKSEKELFVAKDPVTDYNYGEIELGSVKSADGKYDNYYRLIKPTDFDPSKKYPTIIYVYGGPHSQMVKNAFMGQLGRWEMYMAQRGYVVYVQDNRGTTNQGAEFEKSIYGQCGQVEMEDQMVGVKMLESLPYVDADRIGVHGWSYGGFMAISLMTNYPEVFKVGVAGGPVIDWKWYEAMYGERYMGSPHTNKEGYEKTSLINKAMDLKGKLLICQGAIDPVVLWQHSLSFVSACVENGVQVDYFPYPRHEHNVRGRDRIHLMDKVSMYFDDYLKN